MGLVLTAADDDARLDACLAIRDPITPAEPASPEIVRARSRGGSTCSPPSKEPPRPALRGAVARVRLADGRESVLRFDP